MLRLTQGLARAVQTHPEGLATICGPRTRTWRQTGERIARLAGGLRDEGLKPGERVAILSLNSDRYVELLYAVFWAGGVVVPINTRWSAAEVGFALKDSGATMLAVDDRFARLGGELAGEGMVLIHAGDAAGAGPGLGDVARSHDRLIEVSHPIPDQERNGADLAGIFYTGGTTGVAKGVMLSHGAIVSNGLACAPVFRFGRRTRFLHVAPMFHMADAACVFMVTLAGGAHVILPAFDPAAVCACASRHGLTDALLVPTMIQALLDHGEVSGVPVPQLGQVIYGASPMPVDTLRRLIAAAPGARLAQGFGQTELAPIATILEPEDHVLEGAGAAALSSAGRAIPGVDLKVVDEDGLERPAGEVGEVWVRGPSGMSGYWNRPHETAETIRDGWIRTGDAGRLSEDGLLFIVDRVKDMIISGGENVYSTEVENALQSHPAVQACAVIGVPDEHWGERVHAVVVAVPGREPTLEDLVRHCGPLIAGYKHPRSLELRVDPLPLSAAGKVLKTVLRAPYWNTRSRAVN